MSYFRALEPEGQVAVLVRNGVYVQAPLYTRAGYLFAKVGGGFVRLAYDGATSQPNTRIEALVCDVPLLRDAFGRLCDASVTGAKELPDDRKTLLLGDSK